MKMNYLSGPASAQRRARALLAAWNSGNLKRLEAALDADSNCADFQLSAIERERVELVDEVVNAIRGWIASATTGTELQAALVLLRHVACQEQVHIAIEQTQGMLLAGSRSI
jgi:hypothetical protein